MKLDYLRHSSTRMFDNALLETLSRVHPSVPFLFWIPLLAFAEGWALWTGVTDPVRAVALFPVGALAWCFLEYTIHRFLFHWEGSGPVTRRLHEILHGYHHRYPDDAARLVMPLSVSIPLALCILSLLYPLHRVDLTLPFFVGLVSGYLFYDFTHWSTHFRKPLTAWGRAVRAHHMAHHFADPNLNFGISHRWIDALVGTRRRRDDHAT